MNIFKLKINSVCQKTSCLDGKIQFRGMLKKMIVRFTGVNERLFFLTQRRKWNFPPNTKLGEVIICSKNFCSKNITINLPKIRLNNSYQRLKPEYFLDKFFGATSLKLLLKHTLTFVFLCFKAL